MAEQDQDDGDAAESEQDSNDPEDGLSGVRRPMNAFFIFCKRHRDVVREKYPHLENRSITKILGEWWANLDSAEKSSYTALAKQYKEAFMKAHPDFKWYKLPTPPARTLVTRPSNSRCLQTKKDKTLLKSSAFEIAVGKLADDENLGSLSTLISPSASEASALMDESHNTATTSAESTTISTKNILKPPKKRYLVNGEFKCHYEQPAHNPVDHQTQNACSALLELAEICANSAGQNIASSEVTNASNSSSIFSSISGKKIGTNYSAPTSETEISRSNSISGVKFHCDSQKSSDSIDSMHFISPSVSESSNIIGHKRTTVLPLQDEQPLNLCKEKEKTITGSNQQLIDHLVNKFLCDSPVYHSNQYKSILDSSFSDFSPSKPQTSVSKVHKTQSHSQTFTLSAAIETAVDQAYSKDLIKSSQSEQMAQSKVLENSNNEEVTFVNKIKKACLSNSLKSPEKTDKNEIFSQCTKISDSAPDPASSKSETKCQITESSANLYVQNVISSSTKSVGIRKTEINNSLSKYYRKFVSPPKKSRIWCDIFMNEQLKNTSDSESSSDSKKSVTTHLSSPVRRNSQRKCKGRRYQALITEGLLQSTKERKLPVGKKQLSPPEKIKTKNNSSPDNSTAFKSKKKRKDSGEKTDTDVKAEIADFEKNIFDLDEKIASLPKCNIDTLNKKRKLISSISSNASSDPCDSAVAEKLPADVSSAGQEKTDCSPSDVCHEDSASNSANKRFKTGSFDLEQHIASLPKCDIEVLNKRRNKKE